jgi:hypothetical protein
MDVYIAVFMLGVVVTLCVVGTFAISYKDNLFQCVGMAGIAIWCIAAIDRIWSRGWIYPESMWLYSGLFLFALGTFIKVVKHRQKPERGMQ